jgi:hypothetical protein
MGRVNPVSGDSDAGLIHSAPSVKRRRIVLASTGRLGWFLIGIILGAIVQAVFIGIEVFYAGRVGSFYNWVANAEAVLGFLIHLVAWFGLMLAVAASLGSRFIRQDKMNYILVGFGTLIVTLELFSFIQFRFA